MIEPVETTEKRHSERSEESPVKMVRLGDVLVQQQKSKIKAGEELSNGKYPFYTCSNELNKFINHAEYDENALIFGTGGNASVHFANKKFSTSTDCLVFRTDKNVNLSLVNKYLRTNIHLLEEGFKGSGLKHISRDYILNIKVPLPDISEQNRLSKIFDLQEDTIAKHKKLLELHELFIPNEIFYKLKESNLVPKENDVLVTSRGTLGLCYIIKNDDNFYFQDGMITWLSFKNHNEIISIISGLFISYCSKNGN